MATQGVRIVWNLHERERTFKNINGPVAKYLSGLGERVVVAAQARAPVSPDGSYGRPAGYMRSKIHYELNRTETGDVAVEIISPATTPDGYPYGYGVEVGTVPHEIRSHGPYPLRNRRTGQVFGRVVHHPGTDPHPYLRPALEVVRYG
jgi:hypothetical protein